MTTPIGPLADYLQDLEKAVAGLAKTWRPEPPEYRADVYRQIVMQLSSGYFTFFHADAEHPDWAPLWNPVYTLQPSPGDIYLQSPISSAYSYRVSGHRGTVRMITRQVYLPAVYEYAPDEALILETELPRVRPYWNFQVNDPYYNAVEYVYRLSSTNGHFARPSSDGKFRAVLSLEDPGVPNWLDTAGFTEGTIHGRWYDCDSCPKPTLKRVKFADLRNHLPADTPTVTPEQRAEELRQRVRGCQRRRRW